MARPKNCKKCNKRKRPKGNKFKDIKGYCECGRPKVITKEVLAKLEDAFMNAFTDEQACFYAKISVDALYDYQKANPEFTKRKQDLKDSPTMKAKQTVVKALENSQDAWKWLEKRDPDFKPTSKIEIDTPDSAEVVRSPEEKELLKQLKDASRKRIEANSDKMESPV